MKSELEYYVLDGYEVVSYFSSDDESYVAEVPALLGCAAEGETRADALDQLRAKKAEWINELLSMGLAIPAPKFNPDRVLA